jgi:hypothetical protein
LGVGGGQVGDVGELLFGLRDEREHFGLEGFGEVEGLAALLDVA